jgi:predicted N-acetyltransferase YhbS
MTMEYRTLLPQDVPAACELLRETNADVGLAELAADLSPSLSRWPSLQVGAFDGKGTLCGVVAGRIDKAEPHLGWSDDLVVRRDVRGAGLGDGLLTRQLAAFRALGCHRVCGLSPQAHAQAIAFFERHGFRVVERTIARGLWGITEGAPLFITELRFDALDRAQREAG